MLRIAQIVIGVFLILALSRLIHGLEGYARIIVAMIFVAFLGYYYVLTNIYILKKSGQLLKALDRRLEPHRAGHPTLLLSSAILGYGYAGNQKNLIWLGMGGVFLANYLLTIVRSPFDEIRLEVDKENQAKKINDIEINVSPSTISTYHYLLTVRNKSGKTLKNIRIFYEPCILDAENFGIDTTHMPSQDASIHDTPIFIESLDGDETIAFERKGWGSHETYAGPKRRIMEIGFLVNGEIPDRKDRKWCLAKMLLRNAK